MAVGSSQWTLPCAQPGNGGCTLITMPMARRLGIVDSAGRPVGVSRPRYISVRLFLGAMCGAVSFGPLPSSCKQITVQLPAAHLTLW